MVDGVFYVGWKQRSDTFLNAGLDINTPSANKQFYWINGSWEHTKVEGSIMIRPVMGKPPETTSSDNEESVVSGKFRIWPNPASDYINLESSEYEDAGSAIVSITDLWARELIKVPLSERIDVSQLVPGIYTLIISSEKRRLTFFRLVITK
jgi:hypothetical protein